MRSDSGFRRYFSKQQFGDDFMQTQFSAVALTTRAYAGLVNRTAFFFHPPREQLSQVWNTMSG